MPVDREQVRELVNRTLAASEALALFIPEGATYQVKHPRFEEPPRIVIDGFDMTLVITKMAQATSEFYVDHTYIPHDWDGDFEIKPFHAWAIFPFRDIDSRMGDLPGNRPKQHLQGLGMTILCPELDREPNYRDIRNIRREDRLDVTLLSWFDNENGTFDPKDPESILLRVIRKRYKLSALKIAEWILQGIRRADGYN